MKRVISVTICFALILLCMAGCGSSKKDEEKNNTDLQIVEEATDSETITDADSAEKNSVEDESEILVVYFSRTGNTKAIAECVADYYSSDIYEIVPKVPYTDEDIDYNNSESRTSKEQNDKSARPEISGKIENIEKYNTIVLGYPIWWGQAPRIINTFLESYDLSGKTIIPFCTSHSSGIGNSDTDLHGLVSDDVSWTQGKRFSAGASNDEIVSWLEEVNPTDSFD